MAIHGSPGSAAASGDRERIRTVIIPEHEDLAGLLPDRIAAVIGEAVRTKDRCVLGLATGSTPLGIYAELTNVTFQGLLTFTITLGRSMRAC